MRILTKKGYEIDKKKLSKSDLKELTTELTVKPYIPDDANIKSFKVYDETKGKIIIPRFYGIKRFGQPNKTTLKGKKSNYKFLGELRENQINIINKTIPYLEKNKGGILSVSCASGKCLSKGTKVLMYSGIIKNVEDIKVGDLIMGDDSTPRKILSLARGKEEMYDIYSSENEKYTVNKSHILSLKLIDSFDNYSNNIKYKNNDIVDISVEDYLKLKNKKILKGFRVPIEFQIHSIKIDPYFIGYWIGNNTLQMNEFSINIKGNKIKKYLTKILDTYDLILKINSKNDYSVVKKSDKSSIDIFTKKLKEYDLLNGMGIPYVYKCNSRRIRQYLLSGLIDSIANNVEYNKFEFNVTNKILLDDIVYLCRSLGYSCIKYNICKNNYKISVYGNNFNEIPSLIYNREFGKSILSQTCNENLLNYDITVKSVDVGEYYGFEVDGNRRFVLGDFTVTHNTVMALYIGAHLKAKMMVLVHKTFLLNQWMERAKQFTDAKIGFLQRNNIPDPSCDIVIGMIHSISTKNYDSKIFKDFKFLCVDECFVGQEYIYTDLGTIQIETLYDKWYNKDDLPLIKSYNENTKQFEYKRMTFAWKKNINNHLLKINFGSRSIICTENHKFLTLEGYLEANKLTRDMLILTNYNNEEKVEYVSRVLNNDQLQVVLGIYLGSRVIIQKNGYYILKYNSNIFNKEYCEWIAYMFNTQIYELNGMIKLETDIFYIPVDLINIKKNYQWLLDNINIKAIAIWFIEKGKIKERDDDYEIILYSKISYQLFHKKLMDRLFQLDIKSEYVNSEESYIRINQQDCKKFISYIYPYIHQFMIIKYPNILKKVNIPNFKKYDWNNNFLDYGLTRLNKIDLVENKNEYKYIYDIEVEDNHNFIVTGAKHSSVGIIAHNCHHYASPTFSKGLLKCNAPYILGLSATPFRPDKLTKLLFWTIGDIYYRQKTKINKQVICKIFTYQSNDKLFIEKKQWRNGKMKPCNTKMINNLVQIKSRNNLIINILNQLRKYPERKILILSGRKEHLKILKDSVDKSIGDDIEAGILEPLEYKTYYYMGGIKAKHRKEAEENGDMFFATYEMAHEGLDIDRLNTVILVTSKKNIIQSIGRIMRKILKKGDIRPLIIDIRDNISIYKNHGNIRLKQYEKGKYKIENYYVYDEKILPLNEYLYNEYKMNKEEIEDYKKEHPDEDYVPELEHILDLQKVQDEDEKNIDNAEIIEIDPNDTSYDQESDDSDSEEESSNINNKRINFENYLF